MNRREFLKVSGTAAVGALTANHLQALADGQANETFSFGAAVIVDPKPLFEISPHLYMQFMEPLGVTDSSVEAASDASIQSAPSHLAFRLGGARTINPPASKSCPA